MENNPLAMPVILAIMTEFATEILKESIPYIDRIPGKWIAAVIGVLLCYFTDTGLLDLLGSYNRSPYIDYFITGLIISRGSGVVHDLLNALQGLMRRLIAKL